MTAQKLYRLITDRQRVQRQEAAIAADIIGRLQLPQHAKETLRHELYRLAEPDETRSPFGKYTMLSVQQIGAIWKAIRELPPHKRPHEVRHVLDIALLNLRQDTGEIMRTRDEIAEETGCTPYNVSKAMGVLTDMGVIIKGDRRKVAGMRGPGVRAYFINPHAAWNGTLAIRRIEAERQTPPLLSIMQGGKAE